MIHRIAGAGLLIFVGFLLAYKYKTFSNTHLPPSSYEHLLVLDKELLFNRIHQGEHKVTLINLWASWCVPCLKELPDLVAIREQYAAEGLQLILISTDEEAKRAEAEKILTETGVQFPTFYRSSVSFQVFDEIYPNWNGALPASLILDRQGQVLEAWFGETTYKQFEERIKKHIF